MDPSVTPLDWITAIASLVTSVAAVIAALVAIFGIYTWRTSIVGQRHVDLAWEVMDLISDAEWVLKYVRFGGKMPSEGSPPPRRLNLGADEPLWTVWLQPLERFTTPRVQDFYFSLHKIRSRASRTFGSQLEQPIDDITELMNDIMIASAALHQEENPATDESMRRFRKVVGAESFENGDAIKDRFDKCAKQIEEILRPWLKFE